MAEPSLGEINSFNTDANLVKGSPAVVLDISSGLKGAWEAAHSKAQYDWNKYQTHLKQVSDYAANHQLDFAGVMKEDIPLIEKEANNYWSKVAANPKMLSQIGNDQAWSKVQSLIAKSKADNSLLTLQEQFRQKNPDLLNEKNNQIALKYRNTPLDSRNANLIQWDLPKTLDVPALVKPVLDPKTGIGVSINPSIPKQILDDNKRPTGRMQYMEGGIEFPKDRYNSIGEGLYSSNQKVDKYGHTVKEAAIDMFNRLEPKEQEKFKKENPNDPAQAYWMKTWQDYYKETEGNRQLKTIADPAYDRETKVMLENMKARAKQNELAFAHSLSVNDDKKGAEALIRIAAGKVQEAVKSSVELQGTGTKEGYSYRKLDFTPSELKGFGIQDNTSTSKKIGDGLDQETKTEGKGTIYPDEVNYVKGSKKPFRVVFYKRNEDGTIAKNKEGDPIFDREKNYDIDTKTFVGQLSIDRYSKENAPKAFLYADKILEKTGSDLENIDLTNIGSTDVGNKKTTERTSGVSKSTTIGNVR